MKLFDFEVGVVVVKVEYVDVDLEDAEETDWT